MQTTDTSQIDGKTTGSLYTVATPIGNLQDITLRALEVLRSVGTIACEDTRETGKLLVSYDIPSPRLISYHAQSSSTREDQIMELLLQGEDVALVSDRGTPGISDPGVRLIQRAATAGVPVVPIPGATAVIAAIGAAGVATKSFWFRGFIPHKKGRQTYLQQCITHPETVVFYESPHRILKCLEQLVDAGIGERRIVIGRELTKLHEEFLRGTAGEILAKLQSRNAIRGEFVVILDAA